MRFLIDVQNNRLSSLRTRIVMPLRSVLSLSRWAISAPPDLFPRLRVEGIDYFLAPTELGAIELRNLGPLASSGAAYQQRSWSPWIALLGCTEYPPIGVACEPGQAVPPTVTSSMRRVG